MIKPPYTAQQCAAGVWIEDGDGALICQLSTSPNAEAFRVAELFAKGANERLRSLEHVKVMAKKAGRPRMKRPTKAALAKRKQRASKA
jgi:hypothetical protein